MVNRVTARYFHDWEPGSFTVQFAFVQFSTVAFSVRTYVLRTRLPRIGTRFGTWCSWCRTVTPNVFVKPSGRETTMLQVLPLTFRRATRTLASK
jgi:hypothetical protein